MTPSTPEVLYWLMILLPIVATAVALRAGGWLRRLYVGAARLLLGALMLGGGLYKLSDNHIYGLMGPPMDHAFLAKHDLEIFGQFVGVAQLLIGLLLLTGRFALAGALMLVPMWLGIIMLVWSQHWVGTPYLTTGFLVLTLGLLLHDYQRLKYIIYPPANPEIIRAQPLQTGPLGAEVSWWLGAATVVGGSLLYPISLRVMEGTMLAGLVLLLGATGWLWRCKQAARPPGSVTAA
ncbi:DoxX family membrane protein [Hymenobacter elongatus]|uniref:DoxX family membrane protein n=1 Tax=Hymenobacter elongatus TaxID=877208 RepID=A0A4Z0PNX9_9BACT|nr:DoxX family membrane protein [Hymenobacter elongatus]TGE17564.1 DoxX family membrane protein [Hymenobacter elongatus]